MADWPYNTEQWRRLRRMVIAQNALEHGGVCQICGKLMMSDEVQVDHVVPLAQGGEPFAMDNLRAVCAECNSRKATEDRTGRVKGCDENGWPVDGKHEWNKESG